jgi:pilus assembly protein CpaC
MTIRLFPLLASVAAVAGLAVPLAAAPAHKPHHPRAKARPVAAPAVHVGGTYRAPMPDYGTPATGSVSRPIGQLTLSIGRGELVNLPGTMKDVFIADDKVADLQVKSNHQLYVYGKASGETTVYASNAEGRVVWSANVRVGSNIDSVEQMLRVAMPEAHITVSTISPTSVMLTGTVAAPEDAAEAQRLTVAYMGKDATVITRLRTATPLQVSLHVRIAEVSRTLSRTLGTNLTGQTTATNGIQFGISRGNNQGTITNPQGVLPSSFNNGTLTPAGTVFNQAANLAGSTALSFGGRFLGLTLLGSLDLGESIGLATTLAEPNLTTLSGETSDFLAGGEYPIPLSSGLGTVSVEYKNYGVSLSYTPTVLADGRISLRVRPEVSTLSSDGAVSLNGYTIPALKVRRAETTVELGSGQSMMIAGLLSNDASHTITKLPGVGDIPVLGALFKSTAFQKDESELVIVITPYLVKPVNASDIHLPTDGMMNPTTVQEVAGNMLSDGQSNAPHVGATAGDNGAPARMGTAEPVPVPARPVAAAPSKPAPPPTTKTDSQSPGFSLN